MKTNGTLCQLRPTYVAAQLTNFAKLEREMPLGQLHGRTRTGPKALNAAAHLMRTFLISLTDLLEEWLKLSIYR